jgi:type II secretory pathway component PulC
MLAQRMDMKKIRLILNIALGLCCTFLLWLVVDRAFLSQMQISLNSDPLRPLANSLRLTWFPVNRSAPVAEVVDSSEELADASIRAELLGVLLNETKSFAAIQTTQVPDGLYSEGDEIAANVELVRIEADRVIVRERGLDRQIRLNTLAEDGSQPDEELLQSLPQETQGFSLSGVFGATPINVSGHGLAVRVDSLDPEFAEISGLEVSDVLLAINERPMTQYLTNPLMLQQVLQQTLVTVEVLRSGETVELSLNARSLGERILPNIGQGLVQ